MWRFWDGFNSGRYHEGYGYSSEYWGALLRGNLDNTVLLAEAALTAATAYEYQAAKLALTSAVKAITARFTAREASVALQRGVSVIGPRATYREFARKIGANYLDLANEPWTWEKNVKFLDSVIARRDDVVFAGRFSPAQLDPGSALGREIGYLIDHGYSWTDDFSRLVLK